MEGRTSIALCLNGVQYPLEHANHGYITVGPQ